MLPKEIEENEFLRKYKKYDEAGKLVEVYERDVKSQDEVTVIRLIPRKSPLTEEYKTEYHIKYNGDWKEKDAESESQLHKVESKERAEQKRVDREKRLSDLAKAEALLKKLLEANNNGNANNNVCSDADSPDSPVRSGPHCDLMENSKDGGEE